MNKIFTIGFFFVLALCNISAQNFAVIVDNDNFYIKYSISDSANLTIEVEDLKDNTQEGANQYPVPEHVDIYDYCKIEVDRNQDNVYSNGIDRDFLRSIGIGNGGIFCSQYKNSASGLASTDKLLRKHHMYRFVIPFQEAIANNIDSLSFRIKIRRQNGLDKSDNTMYVFPTQFNNEFKPFKIAVPKNLIKRVEKPKIIKSDVHTKQPEFFGIYLFDDTKYYGLVSTKVTKGVLSTYEFVTSGNIETWGTRESGRHIDYIDKQNGFTRVKNENRADFIVRNNIDNKLVSVSGKLSKIFAVGDAGSITNIQIYKIIPRETSEGVILANGYPEGTVIYTLGSKHASNASKTISGTSILYNYPEFEKGMYALFYKGEVYPFQVE